MNRSLLFVTLAAITACANEPPPETSPPQRADESITLQAEPIPTIIPVDGSVRARRRAEIATRLMARVSAVRVDVGQSVQAGETLVALGMDDILANRERAEAAQSAAQAAVAEAERHVHRMDTLLLQDAVAQVQRDQAQLNLTQAEAQAAQAEAALKDVETAASYATIRAPFTGTVISRHVDPGDMANPGAVLLVLEDASPRDGVLYVPSTAVSHVAVGDSILVHGATGESRLSAVRAVGGGADATTRTVEVRVELPRTWATGTVIRADVPSGSRTGILVPISAVRHRGQLTGALVVEDGVARIRWIRIGQTIGDRVEVISGLTPGDRIVP